MKKHIRKVVKLIRKTTPDIRFRLIKPYLIGRKVLDLGVVDDNVYTTLEDSFWIHKKISNVALSIKGIDLNEESVRVLQKRGYDVIVADAEDFSLDEKFDVIFAGEIIEHLENFHGFFTSIKHHLKTDGILIITTPAAFFYKRILEIFVFGRQFVNKNHTCYFDEETIKQLIGRFGFSVISTRYAPSQDIDFYFSFLPLPERTRYQTMVIFAKMNSHVD